MQAELLLANPSTRVRIVGVNRDGSQSGNATMTSGRTLPWLQVPDGRVWSEWGVTYRDVMILDAQNRVVGVYNLTSNDLQNQANYDTLKAMLLQAAGE
jgi:hypothetical protein